MTHTTHWSGGDPAVLHVGADPDQCPICKPIETTKGER